MRARLQSIAQPPCAGPMLWEWDGRTWPNRAASRFVRAGEIDWHVQALGRPSREAILLLHGTGAASHSWRSLAPILAMRNFVVAIDLPGHGFSTRPQHAAGFSLPGMSLLVHALVRALQLDIRLVVGHSAGAAIAAWMCLDGLIKPEKLVGINPALVALQGIAGHVFSPLAKVLWSARTVPAVFAWSAQHPFVADCMLNGTGSLVDPQGRALYARLLRSPGHVEAALAMMANWDLNRLAQRLPQLSVPLLQIVGSRDKTVAPSDAHRVTALLPGARAVFLDGLGHLAHEEQPERVAAAMKEGAPRYF